MKKNDKLALDKVRIVSAEILLAIAHLHKKSICHRDLKPENILVDSAGHIMVGDFGLARKIGSNKLQNDCGTTAYKAPGIFQTDNYKFLTAVVFQQCFFLVYTISKLYQFFYFKLFSRYLILNFTEILEQCGYSFEVDYWAFGIVIFELVTGRIPFKDDSHSESVLEESIKRDEPALDLLVKYTDDDDIFDLVYFLLRKETAERLGSGKYQYEEIKIHLFYK